MKSLVLFAVGAAMSAAFAQEEFDVVIYGSSPAALTAAIEAQKLGKTAVIVCPEKRIGGLTTGGLGQTDIGNKAAFGGLARRFYRDVRRHYDDPKAWTRQTRAEYNSSGRWPRNMDDGEAMWAFEPHVALAVFKEWVRKAGVEVVYGERLDRTAGKLSGGMKSKAAKWKKAAEKLGQNMIKMLYDPDKNLFFDAMADTGIKRPLVTPSGLIPLWGGVPLDKTTACAMIKNWLLNPALMFGKIPFPSVAYNEAVYEPHQWWRGPVWPSEYWLMVEVLEKFGFADEALLAKKKFYQMVVDNGQLYELFNSQTGEGEGNPEQGWTAAVFIRLFSEFHS